MDIPNGTVRRVGRRRSHFSIHSGRLTLGQLTSQLNRGFHRAAMRMLADLKVPPEQIVSDEF